MSVSDVIDRVLGGTNKAAEYLGVSPQAISMMRHKPAFPGRHHIKVLRACEAKNINYDPSEAA